MSGLSVTMEREEFGEYGVHKGKAFSWGMGC